MHLSRALELLVVGLSAVSVAEATFIGINAHHDGRKGIQRRQDDDDAPAETDVITPPAKTTEPPPDPTSTSDDPPVETTTSEEEPPPTTTTKQPDDPPPPTTTSSSDQPTRTSSKDDDPKPTDKPDPTNKPDPTPDEPKEDEEQEKITFTFTHVITSTREDGSPTTYTSESVTTSTSPPGFATGGDENKASEGMSPTTRNTVIGVVVGVGGAIILGGLALVAWRIWGRKKHQEENDGLMDYGSTVDSKPDTSGGAGGVGGGSMASRSPFQSTLESYHAPTQVNTAANF
jgi:hypothetical protein